jgi:hypothetical protein
MGFKGKLSKYFFFKWDYIFFSQNSQKKNVKNATIVYVPFCAKHWRHFCAIPHVIICHLINKGAMDSSFFWGHPV